MSWNYRVFRYDEDPPAYGIHEVYYDDDGNVESITERAVGVTADSRNGVLLVLADMADSFRHPVLDYKTYKEVEAQTILADNLARVLEQFKAEFGDAPPTPLSRAKVTG